MPSTDQDRPSIPPNQPESQVAAAQVAATRDDLLRSTARGAVATFGGQASQAALQIVALIVLARLLSPDAFGLFAMVAGISGLANMLTDFGLGQTIVQKRTLSTPELANLFWTNVGIGIALGVTLALAAPAIALMYAEPRVESVCRALSIPFLFSGATSHCKAILVRDLRLGVVALAGLASVVIGLFCSIIGACLGWGVMALVAQQIGYSAAFCAAVWWKSAWRVQSVQPGTSIRDFLRFGAQISAFRVVNHFARSGDDILIGWFHGAHALGFYTRAYGLFTAPLSHVNGPIGAALLPALSRSQDHPSNFRRIYLGGLKAILWLALPAAGIAFALAEPLILTAMGEAWRPTVPLFQVLALGTPPQVLGNSTGWVMTALGQGDRLVKWGTFSSAVVVVSFVVGLPFGIQGVAVSYICATYLLSPFLLRYTFSSSPVSIRLVLRSMYLPLGFSIVLSAVVDFMANVILSGQHIGLRLFAGVLLGGGTYAGLLLHPEIRRTLSGLVEQISSAVGTGGE